MRRHKILMLVNNDWRIDSRVRREASALAAAGHQVHVIYRAADPTRLTTIHDAVRYHAVALTPSISSVSQLTRMLHLHLAVVMRALVTPGARIAAVRHIVLLLALAVGHAAVAICLLALLPLGLAARLARAVPGAWFSMPRRLGNGFLARFRGWTSRLLQFLGARLYRAEFLRYLNGFGIEAVEVGLRLRPTVVHAHDLTTLSAGFAIARSVDCALVYDAHELETHTNYWSLAPLTKDWIAVYERVLIQRTRAAVTVCDSIADWLRDHYEIPRPVVVLNSPDFAESALDSRSETIRDRLNLTSTTPLAVYVGSVTLDRGARQCVEAVALAPGLHFAFVGPRYAVTETEIIDTAVRLGVKDRVHLVDPVPSREVASFVSTADCSVIAIQNVCLSYYFCFPNKLLESVMSGVPVAVARLVELEKFVGRFPVGIVMDESDPSSIANAIRQLVDLRERYRPSQKVLDAIREEFGWGAQVHRLQKLYETLA